MTGLLTDKEVQEFTSPCRTCGSFGFGTSILGKDRCSFCDGTEGGNPPEEKSMKVPSTDLSNIEALIYKINNWGVERNITDEGGATVLSQMSKMQEEFAEFLGTWDGITERLCPNEVGEGLNNYPELKAKLDDDFGDMLVCIIQAMRLAGTDTETCLTKAWEDIKDRKGRMENGKFIKDSAS